jgi:ferredoxin
VTEAHPAEFVHLEVDGDLCRGHGRCYSLFPDLFDADDQSMSRVISETAPATEAAQAASNCPERAIAILARQPETNLNSDREVTS